MLTLLQKEFTLDLRRKSIVLGIVLYLLSTTFICYLTFSLRGNSMSPLAWSALYWIIVMFSGVNSVAKSFIGEKKGVDIYLYSVADPHDIILSKIIYNALLCGVMSLVCFGLFAIFFGNPVVDMTTFSLVLLLAPIAFSGAFTMLSGIASRSGNSNVVMAVLSFPVIISTLLLVVKITKNCIDGLDPSISTNDLLSLAAVDALLVALSYILFPFVWRS
ncbi:MAG: heme exporter protein CcmB [Bacteroidota bacterium]